MPEERHDQSRILDEDRSVLGMLLHLLQMILGMRGMLHAEALAGWLNKSLDERLAFARTPITAYNRDRKSRKGAQQ